MLQKIFPHPVMTVVLALVWVALVNTISIGTLLFGLILGVLIPLVTQPFWPEPSRVNRLRRAIAYIGIVAWDIVVANLAVAYAILFKPAASLETRFISVPLDIETPEAVTLLAGTITMTPGTVSCDLSADGRHLLVHALDCPDEAQMVREIKTRYERRLQEMFR